MAADIIRNEDIDEVSVEIPRGHRHIRTEIRLKDGDSIVLQEATVSNILRAFISVKTHPVKNKAVLKGRHVGPAELKDGYADWQLMEQEGRE